MRRPALLLLAALSAATALAAEPRLPSYDAADYDVAAVEKQVADAEAASAPADRLAALKARLETVRRNLAEGKTWAAAQGERVGAIHGTTIGVSRAVEDAELVAKEKALQEAAAEHAAALRKATELRAKRLAVADIAPELSLPIDETRDFDGAALLAAAALERARRALEAETPAIVARAREEGRLAGLARARAEGERRALEPAKGRIRSRFYDPAGLTGRRLLNRPEIGSRAFAAPDFAGSPNYRGSRPLPHPELSFAYREAYDRAYYPAAARAYEEGYAEAFERLRESYRFWALRELASGPVGPEIAELERASRESQRAAFAAPFTAAFEARRRELEEALVRRERESAERAGFDARVEAETTAAVDALVAAEGARLAREAELSVTGVTLADANDDTIFAPGEGGALALALHNYGEVPQAAPLEIAIDEITGPLRLTLRSEAVVEVPGRSTTVVGHLLPFFVAPDAREGQEARIRGKVSLGGKVLSPFDLRLTVRYPYAITELTFPPVLPVGRPTTLGVSVRNTSSRAPTAPLRLTLAAPGEPRITASAEVSPAPGQAARAEVTLEVPAGRELETLELQAGVWQGDWLLGHGGRRIPTTLRYGSRPEAEALLVVTNDAGAAFAKALLAASRASWEIWDARDSALGTSPWKERPEGRPVVALDVDPSGGLAPSLHETFRAFAAAGGQFLQLRVGEDEAPSNTPAFGGLSIVEQPSFGPRGLPWTGGARQGRFATARGVSAPAAAVAAIRRFLALSPRFDDKLLAYLRASASGDAAARRLRADAILRDLLVEMLEDEARDLDNFDERRAGLRLSRYVARTLASTGRDRQALQALYPEVLALTKRLRRRENFISALWSRQHDIRMILKPIRPGKER